MADEPTKLSPKKEAKTPARMERRDPLASLRDEVDRLFDDFSWRWPLGPFTRRHSGMLAGLRDWPTSAPAIDIVDLDKEIQVRAELPGMEEKDIDIELSGRMLTIRGEKKEEQEKGEKGSRYYLSERRYGSFERILHIPEGADCAKPEARFANGVLTVAFPKTKGAQEKAKKIKIKSG